MMGWNLDLFLAIQMKKVDVVAENLLVCKIFCVGVK